MTTELLCLVANALWGFFLVFFEIGAKTRVAGLGWNTGNREAAPDFPPWVSRAGRALANHKENFPFFLTAVLVVHLAGREDGVSAAAAVVYVIARALHATVYVLGVKGLRGGFFAIGTASTFAILSRLLP